jgi:hypothetical protein
MVKFNRRRLIFGLFILALITITELVTERFKLPAWPAYTAWIMFFIEQHSPKKVPHILLGALTGIGLILLAPAVIGSLAPSLGLEWARLLYILAAVYAIVAFGEMVPWVLNSFTFLFFTVAGLALATPAPNPYLWAVMAAGWGGLLIGGTILFDNFMGPAPAQAPGTAHC